MKAYGMTPAQSFRRIEDKQSSVSVGANTRAQGRCKANGYRSLRRGKKARVRQRIKGQARTAARIECQEADRG